MFVKLPILVTRMKGILPGSKATAADLELVRSSGIESGVRRHLWNGQRTFDRHMCRVAAVYGKSIRDPLGIESDRPEVRGLGILDVDTEFVGEKVTVRTDASVVADSGLLAGASGVKVSGYEIHVGV